MPSTIKGQTRVVRDDNIGRNYSHSRIDQVIHHGINLRPKLSRTVTTKESVCQCDDIVQQHCLRGKKPFCTCKNEENVNEARTSPSILNMKLPQFSKNGKSSIGSKFYQNGERSKRRNDENKRMSSTENNSSTRHTKDYRDNSDRQEDLMGSPLRHQYFERNGSSPDLTQVPSSDFPTVGHPTKLRGQSFTSKERHSRGGENHGPSSDTGSAFDNFNHFIGGFNPENTIAENTHPSPSTTAHLPPLECEVHPTYSTEDYDNLRCINQRDNNNNYYDHSHGNSLGRQVTVESLHNTTLFSLSNKKAITSVNSCCVFCKIGFYVLTIVLIWLLMLTLKLPDKESWCKFCSTKLSRSLNGNFDAIYI